MMRLTAAEAKKLVFHDEAGEWKVVTRWMLEYHDAAIVTTGDGTFWKYVYSVDDAEEDVWPDAYDGRSGTEGQMSIMY